MTYNPDQPRVPAGEPGGGRFAGGSTVGPLGMRTIEQLRGVSGPPVLHKMSGKIVTPDGPRLVSLDDADIVAARYLNSTRESTDKINTPERAAARREVENRMYGTGAKTKEKEAWIVIGGPGTGKSSARADPLTAEHGALLIDSDVAKGMKDDNGNEILTEYRSGSGADAVHEESSNITGNVLARAVEAGDNLVMPVVGANTKSLEAKVSMLQDAKYKVHIVFVDVDPREGARRAIKRWRDGIARNGHGRFVDPYYVLKVVGTKPRSSYAALKTHPGVYDLERWDNNGKTAFRTERVRGMAGRSRR